MASRIDSKDDSDVNPSIVGNMAHVSHCQVFVLCHLVVFGGKSGREAVRGAAGGRLLRLVDLLSALLKSVRNRQLGPAFAKLTRDRIAEIERFEFLICVGFIPSLIYNNCSELSLISSSPIRVCL